MRFDSKMTRRQWLAAAAAAAGSAALPRPVCAWPLPSSATGDRGPLVRDAVPAKLEAFPRTQVRLRPGIFQRAMQANRRYLDSLPNDRLLHMFRVTAGLPSSAEPLGGWEEPKCELRGHFAGGHILSACALQYTGAGDDEMKSKGDALVAELARCQQALGANGYLSAYPAEFYDRLREGKKVWAPFYTYHKILAGHLDMYVHCGNEQALATAEKMAGWVESYLKPLGDEQWARMQMVEHGGMNEALFELYAFTGKERYLALARRFDHKRFFDPLAQHRDVLRGLHANTNIPKVIGAARGYELTGDKRYREIAEFFWKQVTSLRTYCTGGTSNNEEWPDDPGKLARQLGPSAEECCCGYNLLKLTRHIFGWTGALQAMDYYERTLFNSRLGTQDADGMKMYYLSLMPGLWKTFGTPDGAFWCCTGTGAEEFAKLGDTIYWRDAQGIYVNLLISSELSWPEKKILLVQETAFPEEEGTTLTIRTRGHADVPLHLRVPAWATRGVTVTINGIPQQTTGVPTTHLTLARTWRDGDKIQVRFPMSLRTESIPDDPTLQAVLYGPVVLAGRLGTEGLTRDLVYGPLAPDATKQIAVPPMVVSRGMAADFVEPVRSEPLAFRTAGQTSSTRLSPLYQILDERYTVYWKTTR
jgi:hypothetical protein